MVRVVFAGAVAVAALAIPTAPKSTAQTTPTWAVQSRQPLHTEAVVPLPLGAIRPAGWLRRQLQVQADGLTGHLDEFWPDVGPNSGWLGGTGESWERGPYFVDGLIPLAYVLNDQRLIAKARPWLEWTLTHQGADGRMGPVKNTDWWPNMVMLKALTQYQEATGDARVMPFMQRYFAYHLREAGSRPLREWAAARWGDELVSVIWLFNRTGDPALLKLARVLHDQGADWKAHFANFEFREKSTPEALGLKPNATLSDRAMHAHGVNNAMALKTSALWSLISGDPTDRDAIHRALEMLDRYHGLPNGMFSADEHYAGQDPSQGTELCAVVEALFSLQQAIRVTGDAALADRLERIAFNALPATFTADMWAHQYDQQPNQVLCTLARRNWSTNGPESNIFGIEPNFGCCTANMHQGWPKLVQSLWMATPDKGLAAVTYAPSDVRAVAGGVEVTVVEDTDYPFSDRVRFTVTPATATTFSLMLRIPGWATDTSVTVNGARVNVDRARGFARLEREWNPGDVVVLRLPMTPRVSTWYRQSVAVERGPLVFALRLGTEWNRITSGMSKPAPAPAIDWEVRPTTPWNYGLIVDPAPPSANISVKLRDSGKFPFSPDEPPVELSVQGRRVDEWTIVDGSAGPLPQSPVTSTAPVETLTLIPYGSAKLRVTAFPVVRR
jgi:hypothetical protein